ncbi:hypothetical protein [Corynebacterium fournieri]|uniref:hypothetical protein n=1 Tax=Corynebacterium fournieri TaxID=1852390 RepID=UPI000A2F382E|nr:hypothetical protein [Corynebacterium fournieri]WJY96965.1 hypothetical protein CFOUR_02635 [Corynebacterium fournieri]
MRAAFRNSVAAGLAAAIAFSGVNVAEAAAEFELAPMVSNTAAMADSDSDGLPDIWEQEGVVLADGTEIPLPDWGADPNRPDLFVQLNWMASEYDTLGCDTRKLQECADANRASYAPSKQSLDELVNLFDAHGITLHIDAGAHYSNIPHYAKRFGGETLDYRPVYFDGSIHEAIQLLNTVEDLGDRANIFRPGVLGDRMRAGSNTTGLSLVGDNSFYVANPGGRATDEQVRNTILHEFGHTLGLRHWGAQKYTGSIAEGSPMQEAYHSVMNYDRQFDYFNYSEQPYFADTPEGKLLVPADWDSLEMDNIRIGAYAESIGARAKAEDEVEIEQPEERIEVEKPAPVEVADDNNAPQVGHAANKAEAMPGSLPTGKPVGQKAPVEVEKPEKTEEPAKVEKAEQPAKEVKAEKKAKKKVDSKAAGSQVNVAAIIGGVVVALAALGIGYGVLFMNK